MPGDSLTDNFRQTGIDGEIVVCRECLIEGDVKAETLDEFWKLRASFLDGAYDEAKNSYFDSVAAELTKLQDLPADSEVNLLPGQYVVLPVIAKRDGSRSLSN